MRLPNRCKTACLKGPIRKIYSILLKYVFRQLLRHYRLNQSSVLSLSHHRTRLNALFNHFLSPLGCSMCLVQYELWLKVSLWCHLASIKCHSAIQSMWYQILCFFFLPIALSELGKQGWLEVLQTIVLTVLCRHMICAEIKRQSLPLITWNIIKPRCLEATFLSLLLSVHTLSILADVTWFWPLPISSHQNFIKEPKKTPALC